MYSDCAGDSADGTLSSALAPERNQSVPSAWLPGEGGSLVQSDGRVLYGEEFLTRIKATIALAAASCSDEYEHDLPESLLAGLEQGPYGYAYLKQLDQALLPHR